MYNVNHLLPHLLPTDYMVVNWLKHRRGALLPGNLNCAVVTLDGVIMPQVTACSEREGWAIVTDDPPRIFGDYIREYIRFGKVEVIRNAEQA